MQRCSACQNCRKRDAMTWVGFVQVVLFEPLLRKTVKSAASFARSVDDAAVVSGFCSAKTDVST